jgi:hypothetical protein
VDPGEPSDSENLDRLRELLAGLGGALGGGGLLGWVGAGDIGDVPRQVFTVVGEAGLLGDGDLRRPVSMPADAAALMSLMWEVEAAAALELLASLAGTSGPSRVRQRHLRRSYAAEPRDIFAELAGLTGPGTRWWTNTDLTNWNPITQHTFDAVVVAAGNGIIVTLIAFEGGG